MPARTTALMGSQLRMNESRRVRNRSAAGCAAGGIVTPDARGVQCRLAVARQRGRCSATAIEQRQGGQSGQGGQPIVGLTALPALPALSAFRLVVVLAL